eukprot:TRINITY_DN5541_c0_g1_i1.p1 TRINITY_DN5541_c0_g1~~TRINITY_DN5541_c0_g1_i1.p1  ORF type:complete len:330 (+),score=62.00 TRINITY_DN5541_c0_g1_i1:154-1143(+)
MHGASTLDRYVIETEEFIGVIKELLILDNETFKPELYDFRNSNNNTFLEVAIENGMWDLVDWLLEKDENGITHANPRAECTSSNCLSILGYLDTPEVVSPTYISKIIKLWEIFSIEYGLDVNTLINGYLPYYTVTHPEILKWIIDHHKLDFEIFDCEGKTPLHNLVDHYFFSFLSVDLLLKAGADKTVNTFIGNVNGSDTIERDDAPKISTLTKLFLSTCLTTNSCVVGILLLVSYGADVNQEIYVPADGVHFTDVSTRILDCCRLINFYTNATSKADLCLLIETLSSSKETQAKAQVFVQQYREGLLDTDSKIRDSIKELFGIELELK